ncbi:hypothetical protein HPP92_017413 [Vanilla planifolia]|uniref:Uncharacterized protein n=1 Tax=Vanilla planifolia TaxID=51239 RepID=A0A835UPL9_VANPL|nr:hypothetical protein HPP92_017413 [Vanilla planifolia]
MGILNDVNSNESSPFDINDFPQLTGRPNSAGGSHNQLGLKKQSLGVSSIVQQNQNSAFKMKIFLLCLVIKGNCMCQREYKLWYFERWGRSWWVCLGGSYPLNRQQQQQQGTSVGSGGGIPFPTANNQDLHMCWL